MSSKWCGPYRVVQENSSSIFVCEDIVTAERLTVHYSRMIFYRGDLDGVQVDERLLKLSEHIGTEYQEVNRLVDIRQSDKRIEVLVQWEGLLEDSDRTWEPLQQLYEDVPDILDNFLQTSSKRELKRRTQDMLLK